MKQPIFKATALSLALAALTPVAALAAPSNADVAKQLEALNRRVQELEQKLAEKNATTATSANQDTDQRIRILDRKLELAQEDAKAVKTAATKAQADADKKAKALPTFYGKLHVGIEHRDLEGAENILAGNARGNPGSSTGVESFASRVGIKGEVDLGAADLK